MADVKLLLLDKDLEAAGVLKQLADAARDENERVELIQSEELNTYVWPHSLELETVIEACRLFGNLCYDSGSGRSLVSSSGILTTLHTSLVNQTTPALLQSRICLVLPAFIQNFVADNPSGIELVSDLLDLLAPLTEGQDVEQLGSYADLLSLLAEEEEGLSAFSQPVLSSCCHVYQELGDDTDYLNLMIRLSEDDKLANQLTKLGLHTSIVNNLHSIQHTVDDREVVQYSTADTHEKSANELNSELLVVLLTNVKYKDIETGFLTSWLSSGDSLLASTALLVLGNLCTSDEAMQALVTDAVLDQCLLLLQHRKDERLQHGLLGCLRNFAVNAAVREELVRRGLASKLLEVAEGKEANTPTLLKIVSVLRLLTQNSESTASEIGTNSLFITKLVSTVTVSGSTSFSPALGQLTVETARLLSSVITLTKNKALIGDLLDVGVVPVLLALLSSPHPVLVNQAVLPLVVAATLHPAHPKVREAVNKTTFDKLANILDNLNMPMQIKENVVKLVTAVSVDPAARDYMKESNLKQSLENFSLKCTDEQEAEKIRQLYANL